MGCETSWALGGSVLRDLTDRLDHASVVHYGK